MAALASIMVVSPAVVAVALGVLMLSDRSNCPKVWSVPALLLFVLVPEHGLFLPALLPILFWPVIADRDRALDAARALVGTALVWHMAAGGVSELLLLSGGGVLFLIGRAVLDGRTPGDLGAVRPLLLMALVIAAHDQDLAGSARVALQAALLDLTLLVILPLLSLRCSVASVLRLPFPPMPGFVVLWLGIHAALGMSAGLDGWSLQGTAVAVSLGLLALCDVATAAREIGERRASQDMFGQGGAFLFVAVASLAMPATVFGAMSPALRFVSGGWTWPVWSLGGGDGAFLRLMLIWFCGAVLWCFFVRPWRIPGGVTALAGAFDGSLRGLLTHVAALPGEPPALGWAMRRPIVDIRRRARAITRLRGPALPDMRRAASGVWLLLLGLALAVLGVMS